MTQTTFFNGIAISHRSLSELAMSTEHETDPETLVELQSKLDVTLRRHFEVEDEELYPTLLEVVDDWVDRGVLLGAHEDHQVIMRLLKEIENTPPSDERFRGKVHTLSRLWDHHIAEEEGALYDMAVSYLDQKEFTALCGRIRVAEKAQKESIRRSEADAEEGEDRTSKRESRQTME